MLWTFTTTIFSIFVTRTSCSNVESRLIQHLLTNYDPMARPVKYHGDPVILHLGIALRQLLEVNEKAQTLTFNIWLITRWKDINFSWNSSEFENASLVRVPVSKIWHPDIMLQNHADIFGSSSIYESHASEIKVEISSAGSILHVQPLILKSTCKMDVTWFPFDSQTCQLQFGSWVHSALEMDIELLSSNGFSAGVDGNKKGFMENGQWNILELKAKKSVDMYDCCTDPYTTILFTLHMKRRTLYYAFNLIVPCALIGFLALLGFTLPPDSKEKLSLGVTVLFSLIVFLNMISESMPANSDAVPLLGTYFNCVMVMIASSVVSTIVVNLNARRMTPPTQIQGRVARQILLKWLPKILMMDYLAPSDALNEELTNSSVDTAICKCTRCPTAFLLCSDLHPAAKNNGHLKSLDENPINIRPSPNMHPAPAHAHIVDQEWKCIAIATDRFFFLLSILFTILTFTVFLASAN